MVIELELVSKLILSFNFIVVLLILSYWSSYDLFPLLNSVHLYPLADCYESSSAYPVWSDYTRLPYILFYCYGQL